MSEVLPSQKSDLLSILIRAALVGMLVQPETVPTEGSDEFVVPHRPFWVRSGPAPRRGLVATEPGSIAPFSMGEGSCSP
jgi:hypothetical protein